jgi:hypothetical protein
MTDEERNERDTYLRSITCVETELTDMPTDSLGFAAYTGLKAAVADIDAASEAQSSEDSSKKAGTAQKRSIRNSAKRQYRFIADTAKTIARKKAGYAENFPAIRNMNDEQFFAAARAASAKAAADKKDFTDLGHTGDFLDKFNATLNNFDSALGLTNASLEGRGAAVAGIDEAFERAEDHFETLNRYVLNFYSDNPQKLAAWAIASHVERAPKKKKGEEPTPPTPPTV